MTHPAAAWASTRRLLCIRLDSMGDVLMTTPAIRALKESGRDRHITLLTSPSGAAVAALVPHVDDVVPYDAPWLKATRARLSAADDRGVIETLRDGRFDGAVIFTVFSQSALPAAMLCHLADIPLRLAHARENPYQLLTTWVPDPEPAQGIRHEVERQLALVAEVGSHPSDTRLVLRVPAAARAGADALLTGVGIGPLDPWLVLHPGASAASRRYPSDRFARAVRAICTSRPHRVLVTGDANESVLVADVCARVGKCAVDLAGRLDFAALAALIAAAPLLITNNTGPAHIAAAVGTPVVDLYALTNPQHTPWQVASRVLSHDVPCRNCFKSVCPYGHNACLRGVEPDELTRAALELLALSPRSQNLLENADVYAGNQCGIP
jgi:lipopolysaccharide heptosyltransferase II